MEKKSTSRRLTIEEQDELIRLHLIGYSKGAIAKILDINLNTVTRRIQQNTDKIAQIDEYKEIRNDLLEQYLQAIKDVEIQLNKASVEKVKVDLLKYKVELYEKIAKIFGLDSNKINYTISGGDKPIEIKIPIFGEDDWTQEELFKK